MKKGFYVMRCRLDFLPPSLIAYGHFKDGNATVRFLCQKVAIENMEESVKTPDGMPFGKLL